MKLNELFQRSYQYNWIVKKSDEMVAEFKTEDDRTVNVGIECISWEPPYGNLWDVLFTVDGYAGETGSGDQIRIFSTVLSILKDFDRQCHPLEIQFSAANDVGDSRIRLYRSMLTRFGQDFWVREQDRSEPGAAKVKFVLTRKNQPT